MFANKYVPVYIKIEVNGTFCINSNCYTQFTPEIKPRIFYTRQNKCRINVIKMQFKNGHSQHKQTSLSINNVEGLVTLIIIIHTPTYHGVLNL